MWWPTPGSAVAWAHCCCAELAGRAADVGINPFTAEILTEYAPTLALLQQLGAADMTRDGSTVAIAIDAKKPMLVR